MGKLERDRQRFRLSNIAALLFKFHQVVQWEKFEEVSESFLQLLEETSYRVLREFSESALDFDDVKPRQIWKGLILETEKINVQLFSNKEKKFEKDIAKLTKPLECLLTELRRATKPLIDKLTADKIKELKSAKKNKNPTMNDDSYRLADSIRPKGDKSGDYESRKNDDSMASDTTKLILDSLPNYDENEGDGFTSFSNEKPILWGLDEKNSTCAYNGKITPIKRIHELRENSSQTNENEIKQKSLIEQMIDTYDIPFKIHPLLLEQSIQTEKISICTQLREKMTQTKNEVVIRIETPSKKHREVQVHIIKQKPEVIHREVQVLVNSLHSRSSSSTSSEIINAPLSSNEIAELATKITQSPPSPLSASSFSLQKLAVPVQVASPISIPTLPMRYYLYKPVVPELEVIAPGTVSTKKNFSRLFSKLRTPLAAPTPAPLIPVCPVLIAPIREDEGWCSTLDTLFKYKISDHSAVYTQKFSTASTILSLIPFGDSVLLSTPDGVFKIEDGEGTKIGPGSGAWIAGKSAERIPSSTRFTLIKEEGIVICGGEEGEEITVTKNRKTHQEVKVAEVRAFNDGTAIVVLWEDGLVEVYKVGLFDESKVDKTAHFQLGLEEGEKTLSLCICPDGKFLAVSIVEAESYTQNWVVLLSMDSSDNYRIKLEDLVRQQEAAPNSVFLALEIPRYVDGCPILFARELEASNKLYSYYFDGKSLQTFKNPFTTTQRGKVFKFGILGEDIWSICEGSIIQKVCVEV